MLEILKAILKTGSGTIVTIILGVLSTKTLAVVIGSSGVGLYSLISQTLATAVIAGTIGGQTAFVQGLASKQGADKDKYLTTVFWIFAFGAIVIALCFILFSPLIAQFVFASGDKKIINLVRWMSLPVILTIIYSYLVSLLNGFRAIGRLVIGQVIVSVVTVLLVYPVSKLIIGGHEIAFIAMISTSTLSGIIFCFIVAHKEKWLSPLTANFLPKLDKEATSYFYYIARTTLLTGLITAGTILVIRTIIVKQGGLSSAGIFDVAWMLSMTYVMLLLSSFGTYYLPTLSGINDVPTRKNLIQNLFKISVLLVIPLIIAIIVLKPLVITLLYTHEFASSLRIIRWMLIGDYFKISSWVLAMPMLAYKDMKSFFWTELLISIKFLILSYVAVFYYNDMQLIGVAFLIIYALYFVFTIYYAYKKYSVVLNRNIINHWILGLLLIVIASWQTWNETQVNWISAPFWIIVSIGFSGIILSERQKGKLVKMIYKRENKI